MFLVFYSFILKFWSLNETAHMTYKGFNAPVSLTYAVATTYCAADALDKCKFLLLVKFGDLFYRGFSRFYTVFLGCGGKSCSTGSGSFSDSDFPLNSLIMNRVAAITSARNRKPLLEVKYWEFKLGCQPEKNRQEAIVRYVLIKSLLSDFDEWNRPLVYF